MFNYWCSDAPENVLEKMKIIDNKKDYYDYLSGIYGIDEIVVFDRRGSQVLSDEVLLQSGMAECFYQKRLESDKPLETKHRWSLKSISKWQEAMKSKRRGWSVTWQEGCVYHYILEVGWTHYYFEVERWLVSEPQTNEVIVDYRLIDKQRDVKTRFSEVPVCIIPCDVSLGWCSEDVTWRERTGSTLCRLVNPILSSTYIPRLYLLKKSGELSMTICPHSVKSRLLTQGLTFRSWSQPVSVRRRAFGTSSETFIRLACP